MTNVRPATAGLFLLTAAAFAQVPAGVTVTIVDQGAEVVSLVTQTRNIKTASLLDITVCNDGDGDVAVDNALLYQRVNTRTRQTVALYDSAVVERVLEVFQEKNIYAKLFRGGTAASTVASVLLTAFKVSPVLATGLQIAPSVYQAILPVVHSPVDLIQLSKNVLQQEGAVKLPGHSCRAGLAVARTAAAVKTEVIQVQ